MTIPEPYNGAAYHWLFVYDSTAIGHEPYLKQESTDVLLHKRNHGMYG